jgi:hypothetical protein
VGGCTVAVAAEVATGVLALVVRGAGVAVPLTGVEQAARKAASTSTVTRVSLLERPGRFTFILTLLIVLGYMLGIIGDIVQMLN